ncbi:hypothetical protein QCA50_015984 [Cerrena zonata]|uniref:CoA-binding domain-containing protein n=1 Tax=Cerrena zonata TaxID=2478898 RepID=A0AAW0FGT3_9APHY
MSMKPRIKAFFGANRHYVVSGASNNPGKFGFKILLWYVSHGLPVIPVNPKESEILAQPVVKSVPDVVQAAVSKKDINSYKLGVTATTLKEITMVKGFKDVIKGLWFQPGSYDEEVLKIAEKIGVFDHVVHEDECILVRGEEGLYSANL